jgi:hypothetical protein
VDQDPHSVQGDDGRLGLSALRLHHEVLGSVHNPLRDVFLNLGGAEPKEFHAVPEEVEEVRVVVLHQGQLRPAGGSGLWALAAPH